MEKTLSRRFKMGESHTADFKSHSRILVVDVISHASADHVDDTLFRRLDAFGEYLQPGSDIEIEDKLFRRRCINGLGTAEKSDGGTRATFVLSKDDELDVQEMPFLLLLGLAAGTLHRATTSQLAVAAVVAVVKAHILFLRVGDL